MYESFFGLNSAPFHVTPDPALLLLTKGHQEALGAIVYGIVGRKGFVTVTGEVGVGKTTVLRHALDQLPAGKVKVIYLFQPALTTRELFTVLRRELGEEGDASPPPEDTDRLVDDIHKRLLGHFDLGKTVVVAIDEAQNMPPETLESLRVLSNLETSTEKLLQIVLVGQPELDALLARHELRQLEQRIAIRARIPPLSGKEGRKYVEHRLERAAGRPVSIFSRMALGLLLRRAAGNPRRLNILCDNALMNAFGHQSPRVTWRIAREAIAPLKLAKPPERSMKWPLLGAAASGAVVAAGVAAVLLRSTSPAPPPVGELPAAAAPARPSFASVPQAVAATEAIAPEPAATIPVREATPAPAVAAVSPVIQPILPLSAPTIAPIAPPQPVAAPAPVLAPATALPSAAPAPAPPQVAVAPPPAPPQGKALVRVIEPGDTVSRLCLDIYGRCTAVQLRALRQANPGLGDLSRVVPGQSIVFPPDPALTAAR